jgi:hypothetical protein
MRLWHYRPSHFAPDSSTGGMRMTSFIPAGSLRLFPACLALLLIACVIRSPQIQDPAQFGSRAGLQPLKLHLLSGDLVVYERWSEDVKRRQYTGTGRRFDAYREMSDSGWIEVPADSVALVVTSRDRVDVATGLGMTLLASYTVVTGLVTISCVADPKSCFGSCPTFYTEDEQGREHLVAEGFSSSVARALEATDLDDLRAKAPAGTFSLTMRNEAMETHAIRSLRLHAVAEPPGSRIFATPDGRFQVAKRFMEPVRCAAPEGDCLEPIRFLDGEERYSETDAHDLSRRETIELEFPATQGGRVGLVIAARHSLVSTFLFYQTLAYLGGNAEEVLVSLERGDEALAARIKKSMGMLGDIYVSTLDTEGKWKKVGVLAEAGPLAADVHLVELPADEEPVRRIRLELTKGFWRLEHVALVDLGDPAESMGLSPTAVWRIHGAKAAQDSSSLKTLLDPHRHLVTGPGDGFRLEFQIPESHASENPGDIRYRLFLESTGYYYEWMRREWLREESPELAHMMLYQPEIMFRQLAADFKSREAGMEKAFWNSRFRR